MLTSTQKYLLATALLLSAIAIPTFARPEESRTTPEDVLSALGTSQAEFPACQLSDSPATLPRMGEGVRSAFQKILECKHLSEFRFFLTYASAVEDGEESDVLLREVYISSQDAEKLQHIQRLALSLPQATVAWDESRKPIWALTVGYRLFPLFLLQKLAETADVKASERILENAIRIVKLPSDSALSKAKFSGIAPSTFRAFRLGKDRIANVVYLTSYNMGPWWYPTTMRVLAADENGELILNQLLGTDSGNTFRRQAWGKDREMLVTVFRAGGTGLGRYSEAWWSIDPVAKKLVNLGIHNYSADQSMGANCQSSSKIVTTDTGTLDANAYPIYEMKVAYEGTTSENCEEPFGPEGEGVHLKTCEYDMQRKAYACKTKSDGLPK